MSRQIDLRDPESWTPEDVEYLKQRIDSVPEQHRHRLIEPRSTLAPAQEAESAEIARLRSFLELNFPDEMTTVEQGDTPVGVAIRLLSDGDDVLDPDAVTTTDDYDTWSSQRIKDEVNARREAGKDIRPASNKKADYVAALREDDAAQ